MSAGVRSLTVLGEFKPFGLIAEALDGKPSVSDGNGLAEDYHYFLFDPEASRHKHDTDDFEACDAAVSDRRDHELFIRGNRIIWTAGARVFKRFTLPSPVVMARWCRLGDVSEALLCILQVASLTMYSISGEETSIPLPRSITSIWALPFGLLFQQQADASSATHHPVSSTSPLFGSREISRLRRNSGNLPLHSFNVPSQMSLMSSHMILKDPLEEPQLTYIEERGKCNVMKEFDETTIWTSDQIPLMASFNKGKMQHSVWVVEVINSTLELSNVNLLDAIPSGVVPKQFCFRRIWQGKGAQTSAAKVFLATDDDAAPIICFLHQEQRKLLSVRLQSMEINNEILYDIKPDMSWSIPAVAAAPVIVTRPRVKVGPLSYSDIIVLAPDSSLLLYSGKQCLGRYVLPASLSKGRSSNNLEFRETSVSNDLKIIGVADSIDGRLNVILKTGQIFRCALRRSPSSLLANDCITAMAEGLSSTFYSHFLSLLWKHGDSADLSKTEGGVNLEWISFFSVVLKLCRFPADTQKHPNSTVSSWDFLIRSKFHKNFCKQNNVAGVLSGSLFNVQGITDYGSKLGDPETLDSSFYSKLMMETLDCLHAVYESLKLDTLRKRDLELLGVLLCSIAKFLGEESYLDYYVRDFPCFSRDVTMTQPSLLRKTPPSLFGWLENCLLFGCNSGNRNDLPPLICQNVTSVISWSRKIVSFYSLLCGAEQVGKKLSSGVYCNIADGSHCSSEELTVLAMVGERFGLKQLDLLPSGVSLPLRHALDKCRESPPTDWPAAAYVLLGREDLALSHLARSCKSNEFEIQNNGNLISISTPYMLHLHPVTIPSTVSDTIGLEGTRFEDADSVDGSMIDGMEHIFNSSTQLQYGRDLRLNEVRRVLCSARPVAIQTSSNSSASDQDVQQAQLWHLAQRTTSLPLGRGAFTLGTIYTLLTEAVAVPKLVLAGRLPAQQNATVNLDPNVRNIQELKAWPEFHNAVAAGLRLAPLQGKMSRTWIIYNKPGEPNAVHAGLLLALGLHGYLRVLNLTDIYQYYAQEHESTTVGLMLGLTASYRGTMDPSISKSLFVHIPARHPTSFPELELPTLLQSAALMSVGLLYEGSAHPKTMQILMGEIGRRSGGDNVLEREGYAVSAGFSLGLVALGRGSDALGLMDAMVDRLFLYIGGKEVHNERFLSYTLPDDQSRAAAQMMDGNAVNIDVTAPGAIIALALMFLKTESQIIVSKLSIPDTHYELQYVRPDFIMLRVIARNLIMWNRVHASLDWIESQIPDIVKNGIERLGDDNSDIDDMDAEVLVQAYVNIVAGTSMSLGLRFAGTKDGNAQELLYNYALYFLNEIKPVSAANRNFPKGLSRYVDRGTLEMCLHLIVLSLSVVMAGSGHLQTFRLLRFLRSRNSVDGNANYGLQMAVNLAIGFLFLGGGMRTFSTSNGSVAALLITLYPRLPTGPNDNRCHLQAFRHLYVLATEARWVQTVDVDTGLPVYAPLEVTIKETDQYAETSFCEVTPCLLPERAVLKTIRVCGPRYWPQVLEFVPEAQDVLHVIMETDKPWWNVGDKSNPFNSGVLYIKRKVGACSYVDDPIGSQSLLSRAMHKVFGLTTKKCNPSSNNGGSEPGSVTVDQLVGTFSSDPSLIAFAQLCCEPSWNNRTDDDFQEFCLQVLFECVSKDRPALLQVYLSLYTTIGSMTDQCTSDTVLLGDSLIISNLKLAVAYNEALLRGRFTSSRGGIVQSNFLGSIRKRVEDLLNSSEGLKHDFHNYIRSGVWPNGKLGAGDKNSIILSWYIKWFGVPFPSIIKAASERINCNFKSLSFVPLLRLSFPTTDVRVIGEIGNLLSSINRD